MKAEIKTVTIKTVALELGKTELKHLNNILCSANLNLLSYEEQNTLRTLDSILRGIGEKL